MGVFEDFVNANLPLRVVEYNPLNSGYDGDPNSAGAPTQIKVAPIGALYYNTTGSFYIKRTTNSGSWESVGSGGSSTGSGDSAASYLVVSGTSSLSNERTLTAGPGIIFQDNGPNSIFVISSSISGTNLGSGTATIFSGSTNASTINIRFFSLSGSNGISVTNTGSLVVISGISASNIGTGSLIFSGSSGSNPTTFRFNTVIGTGGIGVTNSGSFLVISGATPTNIVYSASNQGGGQNVYSGQSGSNPVNFQFNTIIGGGATSVYGSGSNVVISSSAIIQNIQNISSYTFGDQSNDSTTVYKYAGSIFLSSGTLTTSSSVYFGSLNGIGQATCKLFVETTNNVVAVWTIVTGQLQNVYLTGSAGIPIDAWYSFKFKMDSGTDTSILKGARLVFT